jgi:hypothetical protein
MPVKQAYTIDCDTCPEWIWGWYPTLDAAKAAAVARGWREVIGDDGDHRWYCPNCQLSYHIKRQEEE